MNTFWLSILEKAILAILKRIERKKGSFNKARAERVYGLLNSIVDKLGKAIEAM
jgi:hypothetical protein